MAELPEIIVFSKEMNKTLSGKEIKSVDVKQEKILNMDSNEFNDIIKNKEIIHVYNKGKWIFLELSGGYHILINLGMGADILYHDSLAVKNTEKALEECQIAFLFKDGSIFTSKFWWIGKVELVKNNELKNHKLTKDIAINPLDNNFTLEYFKTLIKGRSQIKNILLNQRKISGIGNVYIQDMLFKAKIHPQKQAKQLKSKEIEDLYNIIINNLNQSIDKGGLAYEKDIFGNPGSFTKDYFLVAYNEGEKCPECNSEIKKIKTGTTSSYVCLECQKL
ncbi:MAG: DNA-formamidopyrimidine glycosylase family protein [Methanobacteriaceae archaeon]